jgi:glucosamine-6-phosphate deaminase
VTALVTIFESPADIGRALAGEILEGIEAAHREGRRYVLGCPSGRSLRETYQALGRAVRRRSCPTDHVVVAMMDEFLIPGDDGLVLCPEDAHYSCRKFGREEILAELGGGELWVADPAAPERFDARLAEAGGIDLFLLASGASDGHVAFNPPGATLDSTTRILRLAESTRRDNLATFPAFRDLAEVPEAGVSVGLGTIASLSRAAVMVIHGSHKRETARRLLASETFDPSWPATVVHACRGARIFLDRAAEP